VLLENGFGAGRGRRPVGHGVTEYGIVTT
jgi:hypothetical protein